MGRPWVKLPTGYQRDLTLALAALPSARREGAELLWARAWAWCGAVESGGFVPAAALAELSPRYGLQRAQDLAAAGLWEATPAGWVVPSWERVNADADEIGKRRQSDTDRQRRRRERLAREEAARASRDGSRDVTDPEVEVDVEAAGSSSATPPPAREFVPVDELPAALVILRTALEAHRLDVRWDKLTPEASAQIAELTAVHGDAALVRVAKARWRPEAPAAYVQAWLADWAAIPLPGERLRVVEAERPAPRVPGSPPPESFRDARQTTAAARGATADA